MALQFAERPRFHPRPVGKNEDRDNGPHTVKQTVRERIHSKSN